MSEAELLAGLVSMAPAGGVTVTVLVIEPTAELDTVPATVNVAVPPAARSMEALMLPEPAAGQEPPTTDARPRTAEQRRRERIGDGRADDVGRAGVGHHDRVGDTGVPGTSEATPSVFVTERSTVGTSVSTSVAELFDGVRDQ